MTALGPEDFEEAARILDDGARGVEQVADRGGGLELAAGRVERVGDVDVTAAMSPRSAAGVCTAAASSFSFATHSRSSPKSTA